MKRVHKTVHMVKDIHAPWDVNIEGEWHLVTFDMGHNR